MNKSIIISEVTHKIFELRGQRVILDKDIAEIYGIGNRQLKRQVRRNLDRFPPDFMFMLNAAEMDELVCQFGTPLRSLFGGSRPYAFTRNGVNMLAAVLRSKAAVQRSIFIMRAFSVLEAAVGTKGKQVLSSPQIVKQLAVHSRAILRLFKETEINSRGILVLKKLQQEAGKLIQKIVISSMVNEGKR